MSFTSYVTGVPLHRPLRRILYQINAEIKNDEMSASLRYESAQTLIRLWLQKKTAEMPELAEKVASAIENGDCVVNIIYGGSIHVRLVSLDDGECHQWGMSFSHPGNDVPTQMWETQAILTQQADQVYLSAELSYCVAIAGENSTPSVPGFVRDIAKNIGLFSGIPISDSVWKINTDADIKTLRAFLLDPNRNLPVVVLSEPDRRKWPLREPAPEYLISGEKLAYSCFGRCVVVQMPYWPSYKWTKEVGKIWSVFDGGVRIYQPGLDMDEDDIYAHPLYLKSSILNWTHSPNQTALQSFAESLSMIIRQEPTLLSSAQMRLSFSDLYQKKLTLERTQTQISREALIKSYEDQLQHLSDELEDYKELSEDAYQRYQTYKRENASLASQNHDLSNLVETLRAALHASSGQELDTPIPDTYDEMEEWCSTHFPDKLLFTTRARRAIKDPETLYADVPLVYRALCFLAQEYHDLKLGKIDGQVMTDKLNELQLQNRPSINIDQAGQYGKTYFYTDGKGKEHFVDMHLTRGTDRDTRRTLRIYYYWDDDAKKVVVVSLTKHLTSSLS